MNGNYQPPGYPPQPGFPMQQPPPRRGMGCFGKGCLIVIIVLMVLGMMVGGFGWYLFRTFVSTERVAIRVYPATDAEYANVIARYRNFVTAVNAGYTDNLTLSANDLNTLIAKDPEWKDLRGKVYLSIVKKELVAETCFPLTSNEGTADKPAYYFGGKLHLVFSFVSGEFAFEVHGLEMMDGRPAPAWVNRLVTNPDFNRSFSRSFNDGFRKQTDKNPAVTEALAKLRTIIIQDNAIVATAMEGRPSAHPLRPPGQVAIPAPTP